MDIFPRLRTDAVTQYPFERTHRYATEVMRFVDGSEQRFRQRGRPMQEWAVELDLLDAGELHRLREFWVAMAGKAGLFTFHDPWDGIDYPDCQFVSDSAVFQMNAEMRGMTKLRIRRLVS
ncbi:MAG: DUF2460 domain-containing protein [Acidobacteria bacterium]|nr:DUF2460 domain-containing protein [Acidobacteriota bacterium]